MCYAKPGPRCSNHCRNDLSRARGVLSALAAAGVDTASPEQLTRYHKAKERLAAAKSRYDRTPEGQRSMEREADDMDTKAPMYSTALRSYSRDGLDNRQVQKRQMRKFQWDQQAIHDKLLGEVVLAEREHDLAQQIVARDDSELARRALSESRDRLVVAQDDYATTKEGQREAKAAEFALRAQAAACPVARERERLLREAEGYGAWRRERRETRMRQLAEHHAVHDVRERLDREMAAQRAKDVAPKRPRSGAAVPAQRTVEPAVTARAGEGDAWRADPKVQRPQTVVLRAAG